LSAPNKCKFAAYVYTSTLFQKKYAALGITVTLKPGREAGMGRLNEKLHIVKPDLKIINNEDSGNEDEDESSEEEDAEEFLDAFDYNT
jgi:hypothetical protein